MASGRVNVGGGGAAGGGGIGTTMVISKTHEGTNTSTNLPLQIGYYQDIVAGADFNSISLKQGSTILSTTKTIVDRDKLQIDGAGLGYNTVYGVEIPFGALKDVLGNVLKGVYRYSFTTTDAPLTVYYLVTPEISKAVFDYVISDINLNGGTIYFSEGEFRGLFPIKITHSDVSLIGEGNNTKIICNTPNSSTGVGVIGIVGTSTTHNSNVTIESMVIDGDYNSNNADREYFGVQLEYSDYCAVKNCICQNNKSGGIYPFKSSNNNTFIGNTAQNNGGNGISLVTSNNNTFIGNTMQNNGGSGIILSSSNNNTFTGNTMQNNKTNGIYITTSNNNTITGNTMQNNGDSGIYTNASSNCTIIGNTAQNGGSSGIFIATSSNNTITGNTVQNNSNSGIKLSGSNNNIILANKYNSIGNSGTGNILSQNIVQP